MYAVRDTRGITIMTSAVVQNSAIDFQALQIVPSTLNYKGFTAGPRPFLEGGFLTQATKGSLL